MRNLCNRRIDILKIKVNLGILESDILESKRTTEFLNIWANGKGFRDYEEYLNMVAWARGFTCYEEYEKVWVYYPGMPNPIKEDRSNSRFLGVYISENGVADIYKGSQKMPYYNPGYDIICPKGYKIDVKASALNPYNTFKFHINKNMIADYFVLVGFNNIIDLRPLHLWVIKSGDDVRGHIMNDINSLTITNEPRFLGAFSKYERVDKLKKLKNVCNIFDARNKMEINCNDLPNKYSILGTITDHKDISRIFENVKKKILKNNHLRIVPIDECIR